MARFARQRENTVIDGRTHEFHAQTSALSGSFQLPFEQVVDPQAQANLEIDGGYLDDEAFDYRVGGALSVKRSYTQVAGNEGLKDGHGWATVTTTVLEGVNVMEILTADRVVGQILTEHPLKGYVPEVTFLGTRFENLRIAGHPLDVELDIHFMGQKPPHDHGYLSYPPVLDRIAEQYSEILGGEDLPENLRGEYGGLAAKLRDTGETTCTLVKRISGKFPGKVRKNILHIPDFGTVELAKLVVKQEESAEDRKTPKKTTFSLSMLNLNLGCPIHGVVSLGTGATNGVTIP